MNAADLSIAFKMLLIMVSVAVVCGLLLSTNFFKKPSLAETTERDDCQFCLGAKGGVRGNENRFAGIIVCDNCTVLLLKIISVTKHNSSMAVARAFLDHTTAKRGITEEIAAVNRLGKDGQPICGNHSPVGYVCNLKPGHEGRHTLKLDGESFLFWDDPAMKAKAMQPPV